MSHWNYRVVKKTSQHGHVTFEMHEIYYDDTEKIIAWSKDPCSPFGETLKELVQDLKNLKDGTRNAPLNEEDLPTGKEEGLIVTCDEE